MATTALCTFDLLICRCCGGERNAQFIWLYCCQKNKIIN